MADYYPLLARALDAMPDRSPALRKAVYDRARSALIGQLRSLEPPLSDADIKVESDALETAIARIEKEYGGPPPVVANDVAPPVFGGAPERDALPEAVPPSPDEAVAPRRAEPALPPAARPDLGVKPFTPPPPPSPRAPGGAAVGEAPVVLPIKPRQSKVPDERPDRIAAREARIAAKKAAKGQSVADPDKPQPDAPSQTALAVEQSVPGLFVDAAEPDAVRIDAGSAQHRPRIDVVAPHTTRPRLMRNVFVGGVLLVVVGLIAVAAFLLRDKPADLVPGNTEAQSETGDAAASKYADRVGGEAAPPANERQDSSARSNVAGDPAARPSAQPDVAIAQRAVLFEENPAGGSAQPITFQGNVVWRLETMSGERGQPLETVIRGRVTFTEAGLSLLMTIRRNLDAALPASHTIELTFTTTSPAGDKHAVQDVGLLTAKDEESSRGSPVSGLPVRVRENLFLIGLSSLPADVERNTDLLEHRNWLDLPLKFASGPRGVLTFEKGSAGSQVIRSAFEEWRR